MVLDWFGLFNAAPRLAGTIVVSSGTNEAFKLHSQPGVTVPTDIFLCFVKAAEAKGVQVKWVLPHTVGPFMSALAAEVKQVRTAIQGAASAVSCVELIDFQPEESWLADDLIHLNDTGRWKLAETVLNHV